MFAGLSSLAQALQGGPDTEEEEFEEQEGGELSEDGEQQEESGEKAGGAGSALSFWGVASALTATVKAKTAEVLTAVQETDWRAELEAFQQGAKEDAEAVGKGADVVLHKAVAAAEHLPDTAGAALPVLQARAGAAAEAAKVQAGRGLANLAGLGSKIVLGTHDLFEQISNAVQNEMALAEAAGGGGARRSSSSKSLSGGGGGAGAGGARYSRFDADVAAMQRDSSTYCDEPEDEDDFAAWLEQFDLAARRPDIDKLIGENTFMSELQARIVPLIVEYDAFWTRYFYRLHKLELKHQQFVQLTQRAAAAQAEEEVGWSDEEEEEQQQELEAAPRPAVAAPAAAPQPAQPAAEARSAPAPAPAPAAAAAVAAAAAAPLGEAAAADEVAAGAAAEVEGTGEDRSTIGPSSRSSEDSPATTALSSDGSLASGEHWQVVTSPRQQAASAAGAPETPAEAPAAEPAIDESAAEPDTDDVASTAQAGVEEAAPAATPPPAPAGAPAAAPTEVAAVEAVAGDDDELSDWGEEDEAALQAATTAATAAGGAAGDNEEGWGSDWE